MLHWCAYCQKYLGEVAPYSSFEMTHGICPSCAERGLGMTPEDSLKIKKLSQYQASLWEAGARGDLRTAHRMVDEGLAMQLRPLDILMGLVTPALYRVGGMWQKGELSAVEEHRFTRYYEQILEILYDEVYFPDSEFSPKTVLTCSVSNYHTLAVRMIELSLLAQGCSVFSICPGVPNKELIQWVEKLKPQVLGISIATNDQIRDVEELSELLGALEVRPQVYVGGVPIKNKCKMPELPYIHYEWCINKFISYCM